MRRDVKEFFRICGWSVITLFALPLAAVHAQTTTVAAHGATIGNEGVKDATVSIGGINPRIIGMISIQNGDIPLNPANPAGPATHLEATLIASGFARFGSLGGKIETQARNQAPFPNLYEPRVEAFMDLGFTDGAVVTSPTLAVGTPVTINFTVSLAASFFVTTPKPASYYTNGAISSYDVTIKDTFSNASTGAFLAYGSSGITVGTQQLTLETAIGRYLGFSGHMEIRAFASTALLTNPSGGDLIATSAILADHTAKLTYQQTPEVFLISDSGHNYSISGSAAAAPEPAALALVGMALPLALFVRRSLV